MTANKTLIAHRSISLLENGQFGNETFRQCMGKSLNSEGKLCVLVSRILEMFWSELKVFSYSRLAIQNQTRELLQTNFIAIITKSLFFCFLLFCSTEKHLSEHVDNTISLQMKGTQKRTVFVYQYFFTLFFNLDVTYIYLRQANTIFKFRPWRR